MTIWPKKHKRKTPSQAFTRSKQIYRIGRSLRFCGTLHSHGVRLLEQCKSTSMRIVNGRVGNTDQYTFLSHNGLSVIDYLLMHERFFSTINDYCIKPFSEWSNHALLPYIFHWNVTQLYPMTKRDHILSLNGLLQNGGIVVQGLLAVYPKLIALLRALLVMIVVL